MKKIIGKVIAKKFENTAMVEVGKTRVHPLYGKTTKFKKTYPVHDLIGTCVGDKVEFCQSKPFSKTKKWLMVGVLLKSAAIKSSVDNTLPEPEKVKEVKPKKVVRRIK